MCGYSNFAYIPCQDARLRFSYTLHEFGHQGICTCNVNIQVISFEFDPHVHLVQGNNMKTPPLTFPFSLDYLVDPKSNPLGSSIVENILINERITFLGGGPNL